VVRVSRGEKLFSYVQSYKSLFVWRRASEFCLATLEAVDDAWKPNAGALFEQLRRAAISVDVNIVEGYALQTTGFFRKHLRIAVGSAAEAERLLEIAETRGYLSTEVIKSLKAKADLALGALFGLLRSPRLRAK